jgi:hypothetical protein
MPNFVNNTITINGEGQIAAALAKQQLVITRVQVGSGIAAGAPASLTTLVTPVMNLTPQPPQVSANSLQIGEVVVMAVLDSANVLVPFPLTELGVFATSAGGPEQLIAYCQCSSPYDQITPGSGSNRLILNLQVPIVVGVGASVSITVQAGNPVYVPPVVAGPGIVVDSPTDNLGRIIEWIVSTPRITNNTTLYVANEYTQNVAPYFSTLQNAIDYLGSFTISSGVSVFINMAAETFNITSPVVLNHVNSAQITIQGANNPDVTFNGIGTITGSGGNWQVPLLNVSSTANIKVGTWLSIWAPSFNWPGPLVGGTFQVIGVSGSTVTIQCIYYAASWPNMAGTSGRMTPLSTVIVLNNTKIGYGLVFSNGIGLLQYVALIMPGGYASNYPGCAILLSKASGLFKYVACWGFTGNGASGCGLSVGAATNGVCQCCTSSVNDTGFISAGAGANLTLQGCASSHNFMRGIWVEGNANLSFSPGIYNTPNFIGGNRERGVLVSNASYCTVGVSFVNGQLWTQHVMSSFNNNIGFHFANMSRSSFASSGGVYFATMNGNYDVAVSTMSSVPGSAYIQGTRIFNGTPGVILPGDGSLFS